MRHFTNLRETARASSAAPTGPALPFQRGAGTSADAMERAVAHAIAVQGPARPPAAAPVGGVTADISEAVRSATPATPFEGSAALPAPAAANAPVPAGMRHFASVRETQAVSAGAARPATPFEAAAKPKPPAAPPLSLEQYASFCVEAVLAPANLSQVLQRYGITVEQRAALDAHWQGKMASSPEIRAAWERACATYRQWLVEGRGRQF
ncbi:hypothetical protein [Sorangium sp. So ce1335]|uniref:hypothetical protein n=1 Tax=Sorangium sp. So ce1335 TaxID=3133335 RepID=UPI003F5EFA9D